MKPSDDLFRLIKSLSSSEKRYFKLFSSMQAGDKAYLKLFDFIEKQNKYQEEAIKKKFSKENFIKQLAATKYYLYGLILQSMRVYHSQKNVDGQLSDLMKESDFLFQKGLFDMSKKTLVRAKRIAAKYERNLVLAELTYKDLAISRAELFVGIDQKRLEADLKETLSWIDKFRNSRELSFMSAKFMLEANKKGMARSKVEFDDRTTILNNELLNGPEENFSFTELGYIYLIKYVHYLNAHDHENAYIYAKKHAALLADNPHQVEQNPSMYISNMNNLMVCQVGLKKYSELKLTLEKLRAFEVSSEDIKKSILYRADIHELKMHIETGEFGKGVELIKEIISESGKLRQSIENNNMFNYAFSCVYFGANDFSKARKYLNFILNDPNADYRNDLHCFAKILNLIIYFENGDEETMEYVLRSVMRHLFKRQMLYKFEEVLLGFIKNKWPKKISRKELMESFIELKGILEKVAEDPFQRRALTYFDFISWLESKIENKSFAEIVKKKAKSFQNT